MWRMTSIVVVGKRQNLPKVFVQHHLLQKVHPLLYVRLPVNDCLIPRRRDLLNSFPVSEPTHVSEIGSDKVQRLLQFPRTWHQRCVGKHQCHFALSEKTSQSSIEPALVANLDSKAERRVCDSFEERIQAGQKFFRVLQHPPVKLRKLKQHWPEFFTQQRDCLDELIEFRFATDKNFLVSNNLRDL